MAQRRGNTQGADLCAARQVSSSVRMEAGRKRRRTFMYSAASSGVKAPELWATKTRGQLPFVRNASC